MPRPARDATAVAVAALLAVLLLAPVTAAQESTPEPGTGRILIIMNPQGHDTAGPVLNHALIASLPVSAGEDGSVHVTAALPEGATLVAFTLYSGTEEHPDETRVEQRGGRTYVEAHWTTNGPEPGTWVAMRLEARSEPPASGDHRITWLDLPQELTSVRLFLPTTHIPITAAEHGLQREEGTGQLVGWNLTQPPQGTLIVEIRSTETTDDPALGAPPARWAGFGVLIGIAVAAALAWFLGKKLDSRLRGP